jgi:hypothetical protein
MTLSHDNLKPALRLNQRVRSEELTPQAALNLLRSTDPVHAAQTSTYRWLIQRGAK